MKDLERGIRACGFADACDDACAQSHVVMRGKAFNSICVCNYMCLTSCPPLSIPCGEEATGGARESTAEAERP